MRSKETVEQFIARGGSITTCPPQASPEVQVTAAPTHSHYNPPSALDLGVATVFITSSKTSATSNYQYCARCLENKPFDQYSKNNKRHLKTCRKCCSLMAKDTPIQPTRDAVIAWVAHKYGYGLK